MDTVKIGIVGVGNMGFGHMRGIWEGKEGLTLTAVCDIDEKRLEAAKGVAGDAIAYYTDYKAMLASGLIEAVLVAVPHYSHVQIAVDAFEKGLHVLCEKPAGVYTKDVRRMNEAAKKSGKVFSMMYNQRTNPVYKKVRDLVQSGELGDLKRTSWIITNWYRPQAYHDSSTWRSTWSGEGGGALINQCPHQIDLMQWICGMPVSVSAHVKFGSYYNIEVEDDVTAYFSYANGATGTFITSTGEWPGTNRFEIAGTMGRIVVENNCIQFSRLREDEREFNKKNTSPFGKPEVWECKVDAPGENPAHGGIRKNFANAILKGEQLIAPGEEGIRGLTVSNAIHMSAWLGKEIALPLDEDMYYNLLQEKIQKSTFKKNAATGVVSDLKGTY
ncbi:MAG: Gfo/Idh/MocA family oxidoreductase [Clostridia bacterium]|nr:Gfo/Idh/MocA family oxidoreductase [Clostridia bacterium]